MVPVTSAVSRKAAALAAHRSQYAFEVELFPTSILERLWGTEHFVVVGAAPARAGRVRPALDALAADAAMALGECLALDLAPNGRWQGLERVDADTIVVVAPGAGHLAVH